MRWGGIGVRGKGKKQGREVAGKIGGFDPGVSDCFEICRNPDEGQTPGIKGRMEKRSWQFSQQQRY